MLNVTQNAANTSSIATVMCHQSQSSEHYTHLSQSDSSSSSSSSSVSTRRLRRRHFAVTFGLGAARFLLPRHFPAAAGTAVVWENTQNQMTWYKKVLISSDKFLMDKPSQNYGCHQSIVSQFLLAARHKQAHPALTPAGEGWYSISYPGGMEGWVNVRTGNQSHDRWVRSPTPYRCATEKPRTTSATKYKVPQSLVTFWS